MSCKLRDTTRDPSTGQGTRSSDTFQERHAGGLHQCNPSYEASVDDGVGEKRKEDNGQNNDRIWGSQSSLPAPNDDSCFFWLLVRLRPTGRGDQNIYQAKKNHISKTYRTSPRASAAIKLNLQQCPRPPTFPDKSRLWIQSRAFPSFLTLLIGPC